MFMCCLVAWNECLTPCRLHDPIVGFVQQRQLVDLIKETFRLVPIALDGLDIVLAAVQSDALARVLAAALADAARHHRNFFI